MLHVIEKSTVNPMESCLDRDLDIRQGKVSFFSQSSGTIRIFEDKEELFKQYPELNTGRISEFLDYEGKISVRETLRKGKITSVKVNVSFEFNPEQPYSWKKITE